MDAKLLFAALTLALAVAGVVGTAGAQERPGWQLVWHDEFDQPGLPAPAKWDYEVGRVRNYEAQYYTKARGENARKPHYLILNLAVDGDWGGQKGIDPGIFPQRSLIDYVRVYQNPRP